MQHAIWQNVMLANKVLGMLSMTAHQLSVTLKCQLVALTKKTLLFIT